MPIYELTDSSIVAIATTTFSREDRHERADIQRILRDQITVVDSECMVLAEEFDDWDDGTPGVNSSGRAVHRRHAGVGSTPR